MSKRRKQGRWLLEFFDETSQFDPHGIWQGGSECYMRCYKAWIPNSISKSDEAAQMDYLEKHPTAYVN